MAPTAFNHKPVFVDECRSSCLAYGCSNRSSCSAGCQYCRMRKPWRGV
jgi:hypothetical protein